MISRSAESAYSITATDAAEANVSLVNCSLFASAGKRLKAAF
jgi:hypothetical protein